MRNRWSAIALGLVALALAVGAIACSDNNKSKSTATKTAPRQTAQSQVTPARSVTPGQQATPGQTPSASTKPTVMATQSATLGTIVTDGDGRTVYKFSDDAPGVSNCSQTCSDTWPPVTVDSSVTPTAGSGVSGQLATIQRPDGTTQVTLDGSPLYHFVGDAKAGDTLGNGILNKWSVIMAGG